MATRAINIDDNRVYRAVVTNTHLPTNKVEKIVYGPYGLIGSAKAKATQAVKDHKRDLQWYADAQEYTVDAEVQVIEGEWRTL